MPDDTSSSAGLARRLERAAADLLAGGRGNDELAMALDQLHADRANGEPLTSAIDQLRRAITRAQGIAPGGQG